MFLKQKLTIVAGSLVLLSLYCFWLFNQPASADGILPSGHTSIFPTGKGSDCVVFKQEGGSLYAIAKKHYHKANETLFDLIVQANPSIVDVRKIGDDQKIILPPIVPESYVGKSNEGEYRVHIGTFDTFDLAVAYSRRVTKTEKVLYIESKDFSPEDTWYRVILGDFENKEEALKTVNLLKEASLIYLPEPTMKRGQ
jgi:hypothetical protein